MGHTLCLQSCATAVVATSGFLARPLPAATPICSSASLPVRQSHSRVILEVFGLKSQQRRTWSSALPRTEHTQCLCPTQLCPQPAEIRAFTPT